MANHPSRDDIGTTSPAATRRCPVCTATFTPVRRQAYCSERCRKSAWRRRHAAPLAVVVPPTRTRREITVYACPECETRYLGEQWCHDRVRPCIRVGPGGACPHCDEPVAVTDLLDTPTGTEVVTTPR